MSSLFAPERFQQFVPLSPDNFRPPLLFLFDKCQVQSMFFLSFNYLGFTMVYVVHLTFP